MKTTLPLKPDYAMSWFRVHPRCTCSSNVIGGAVVGGGARLEEAQVTGQDNFAARLTLKRTRQSRHPELMKTTQSPEQPVTRADNNLAGRIRSGRAGVWACVAGFAAVLASASPAAGGAAPQGVPAENRHPEPA